LIVLPFDAERDEEVLGLKPFDGRLKVSRFDHLQILLRVLNHALLYEVFSHLGTSRHGL
jgi:hypothetical protein